MHVSNCDLKILRVPSVDTGEIEEYELKERWIDCRRDLKETLEQKGFNEGDAFIAIMDDLERNNLKCIGVKLIGSGPIILSGLGSEPKQRIFYKGYFRETKTEKG